MKVGEKFVLPGMGRQLELTIVGIVHKPTIVAMINPTIYVPLETLQQFVNPSGEGEISRALIDLKKGASEDDFSQRWNKRLAEIDKTLLEHDESLSAIWHKLQPLLQPQSESPKPPRIGFRA